MSLGTILVKTGIVTYNTLPSFVVAPPLNPDGSLPAGNPALLLVHAHPPSSADYVIDGIAGGGWDLVFETYSQLGGKKRLYAFRRTLAAGDSAWQVDGIGTPPVRVWQMIVAPGGDLGTVGAENYVLNVVDTNESDREAPEITTTADGAIVLRGWLTDTIRSSGPGIPSGTSLIANTFKGGNGGSIEPADMTTFYRIQATAGLVAAESVSPTNVVNDYVGFSIEVKPAATALAADCLETVYEDYRTGVAKASFDESVSPAQVALREYRGTPIWLVKAEPTDRKTGQTVTVRAASGAYNTEPDEAEDPDAEFLAILDTAESSLQLTRQAFEGDTIGAPAAPSIGEVPLANEIGDDGKGKISHLHELDWHDKPIEVSLAGLDVYGERIPFDQREILFKGRTAATSGGRGSLSIRMADTGLRYRRPLQRLRFSGEGGLEGGVALAGTRKPYVAGYRRHFEPVLVDKQTNRWVYSVDPLGSECTLHDVLSGGQPFSTDDYEPFFEDGVNGFVLGVQTDEIVTCIASGPSIAGQSSASCLYYGMVEIGPWSDAEFDLVSLAIFEARMPGLAGYVCRGETTFDWLIQRALGPIGLPLIDRLGRFAPRIWPNPSQVAADEAAPKWLTPPERQAVQPADRLIRIAYDLNYRRLEENQVSPVAKESAFGDYVRKNHLLEERPRNLGEPPEEQAVEDPLPFETLLVEQADAAAYADLVWSIRRREWHEYKVGYPLQTVFWDPGRVITVTDPDYDLASGQDFVVKSTELDGDQVNVLFWRLVPPQFLLWTDGGTALFQDGTIRETSG